MTQTQPKTLREHKIGDKFNDFLLIKQATKGIATNGQPFLSLLLGDTSDTITTKIWNATDEDVENYTTGTIIHISGTINEYRGAKQLQTYTVRLSQATDNIQAEDLMKTAPESEAQISADIDAAIFNMKNDRIRRITQGFINRYHREFYEYPAAATIHHDFIRGLAYHTVSMLRIGNALSDLYPDVNRDLLSAGIILHDIGKIHEFVSATDTERSLEGNLLGHIPIMTTEIGDVAKSLNISVKSEEVLLLQHMVLAHHGKPEWGSARTPIVREAQLLHYIDKMDADLNVLDKALSKTAPGNYTEKLFSMDNRSFYKPLI